MTLGKPPVGRRAQLDGVARDIRLRFADSSGVTLIEILVVLLILGVILASMTTLFVSASTSQVDQSNRYQAQHNARLALDNLRREIRCASSVVINSPSSVTVTLPGRCQKPVAGAAAPFSWCAIGGAAPYALWRAASATCTGGAGEKRVAESLSSNQLFSLNRRSPAGTFTLTPSKSGTQVVFSPRRYAYSVTAVVGGKELSGDVAEIIVPTDTANRIRLDWSSYAGATAYRVYGRDDGALGATGLRYMATVTPSTVSYTDVGAPAGSSDSPLPIASTTAPPRATLGISLAFDLTLADSSQRFTLIDDIVLRNSFRN
ncbi:MAG: type II secretion system protein [Gaiellaceae bacterium]